MLRLRTLCVLALAASCHAAERFEGEAETQGRISVVSRHLSRGLVRAGPALQASVNHAVAGFRGELWTSRPFDSGEVREWAGEIAWSRPLTAAASLECGARGFAFDHDFVGVIDRTLELHVGGRWSLGGGLSAGATYHRDVRLQADTGELTIAHSVPLTRWGAFLELRAWGGWSHARDWRPGAPGRGTPGGYGYAGGEARLPYRIGGHATIEFGAAWTRAWKVGWEGLFRSSERTENLTGFAGVTYDF